MTNKELRYLFDEYNEKRLGAWEYQVKLNNEIKRLRNGVRKRIKKSKPYLHYKRVNDLVKDLEKLIK